MSVCPECDVHLQCYRKKHKHFCLIHVTEGRGSVVNAVKVAVEVSVSLHYQQCDNFSKIQQKNAICISN